MPRKYTKNPTNKKRRIRRKPKMNFKKRVLSIVNKNREMKRLFFTIDEDAMSVTGSQMLTFAYPNTTNANTTVANRVLRGSNSYQRNGEEITPKYFQLKGIMKYQGSSFNSGYDEIMVRVVAGFVDGDNAPLLDGDSQLQLSNGLEVGLSSDYTAIMRKFNWKKFRPFYDRTTKLQPSNFVVTNPTANSTTGNNVGAPISRFLNIKHYFGKDCKNQTYNNSQYQQSGNIQVLVISRTTNDDVLVTTNDLEISAEGHFSFYDC